MLLKISPGMLAGIAPDIQVEVCAIDSLLRLLQKLQPGISPKFSPGISQIPDSSKYPSKNTWRDSSINSCCDSSKIFCCGSSTNFFGTSFRNSSRVFSKGFSLGIVFTVVISELFRSPKYVSSIHDRRCSRLEHFGKKAETEPA